MAQAEEEARPSSDRYERLELIGTGSFGEVYRGWDRENGLEVAIKVIDLESVEDDIADIHREVATLAQCRSSNITEYYASVMLPGTTELLIVMELMACSVCDLLTEEGSPLDERSIAFILRETLKALVYLHENHRIHRDVKAANILLSAHGEVKISDFGVSGQLSKTVAFKRKTFVGSPFWMAPEVIRANTGGDGYGESADIWSLGITAYEMAHGKPPHADLHPMRALFLIPAEDAPRLEGPFSMEFKSFVSQCLQKDPTLRPSAAALLRHPFLAGPHDSGRLAEVVHVHGKAQGSAAVPGFQTQMGTVRWDADQPGPDGGAASLRSHQIQGYTMPFGATVVGPTIRGNGGTIAHLESVPEAYLPSRASRLTEDDGASQSELSERSSLCQTTSLEEGEQWDRDAGQPMADAAPPARSAFHTAAENELLVMMLAPALKAAGEATPLAVPETTAAAGLDGTIFSPEALQTLDSGRGDSTSLQVSKKNAKASSSSADPGALGTFLLTRWRWSAETRQAASQSSS